MKCSQVKSEKLDWLSDNPFYTKRLAFHVGRRCCSSSIKDVAKELHLDWKTVKDLEKQYMQEQLRRAGKARPKVIGIDEISVRRGHEYRIVVSDLKKHRPIWLEAKTEQKQAWTNFINLLARKPAKTSD